MVGFYPDPISHRIEFDRDGTFVGYASGAGALTEFTQTQKQALNDNSVGTAIDGSGYMNDNDPGHVIFVFPELRDLHGFSWGTQDSSTRRGVFTNTLVSSDTTNGVDGTWTSLGVAGTNNKTLTTSRGNVATINAFNVRAIKFAKNVGSYAVPVIYHMHLYGEISNIGDRLEFWHPTLEEKISPAKFDWGDVARSTVATKDVRVKNHSDDLTAHGVRVAFDILTDATPSVPAQFQLSIDGGSSYMAQQTIGDIGPGATSGIIKVRYSPPADARLSLWEPRIFAEADSWSVV